MLVLKYANDSFFNYVLFFLCVLLLALKKCVCQFICLCCVLMLRLRWSACLSNQRKLFKVFI